MEWGIHFNIAQKEDRIFTLDVQMSDPTFWDNPDKAREISQEATQLKNAVESYKQLVSDIEDANVMLEMAIEEDDHSQYLQSEYLNSFFLIHEQHLLRAFDQNIRQ